MKQPPTIMRDALEKRNMRSEKKFSNNDIYLIEVVSDKIVINDNYEGILFLDSSLNIIKGLKLFDGLVIETAYTNDKDIVLWCFENRCLVHINASSHDFQIIPLGEELQEKAFLAFCEWVENGLVLVADDGNVLAYVDFLDSTVSLVTQEALEKASFSAHNDWKELSKSLVHKVYPNDFCAIVESDNTTRIVDYRNGTETVLTVMPGNFYDIEVLAGCVVQVSEELVSVSYGEKCVVLYPSPGDRYYYGRFITTDEVGYLLLLSSSNWDSSKCKIEKYPIETFAH
jgi:hypothetical protein